MTFEKYALKINVYLLNDVSASDGKTEADLCG